MGVLENLVVAVPPLEEQHAILDSLRGVELSDRLAALAIRSIEQLREYRQALITAAVTGKIDVSKEAA
jgi:type I restriction enzyme S subunit